MLETERLLLRPFTTDDVDNLVELDSDPDVMRFINGGRPTPRDEVEHEILPRYVRPGRAVGRGTWAAIEKSSGDFVGWFGFRPPADGSTDDPELGYRLRRSAWGRGYATEGSLALIRRGFAEHGVQRVFAQTMTVNIASRRVMEKAGLLFVRTFFLDWPDHIDGAEQGDVEYAVRVADWRDPAALRRPPPQRDHNSPRG